MRSNSLKLWEVRHFDLSLPLPDLDASGGIRGILAYFWWRSIPLGEMTIDIQRLPLRGRQILSEVLPEIVPVVKSYLMKAGSEKARARDQMAMQLKTSLSLGELVSISQPLHELELALDDAVSNCRETTSIVVCTRNRPDSLIRCLISLQRLTTQPYEMIVVDNAPSSDATMQLVASFPGVQYVLEPRPGLSVARNRGVQIAKGNVIAFTDDDVEVHPQWLERLRIAFDNPMVMAMTGQVLPARLETEAEEAFQLYASGFGWGFLPVTYDSYFFNRTRLYGVPVWNIGAGANMAFRRKVFEQLGGFDERLGAGASGCSEDSELWYRVLANGWACQYNPASVVYHHHRGDLSSLSQQMRCYMRGHVVALLIQAVRYQHWGNLLRLFVSLPIYYTKQLILGFLHGFRGPYRTVLPEITGFLMGFLYYQHI